MSTVTLAPDIAEISQNNSTVSAESFETVGLTSDVSALRSFTTLTSADGIYYNKSLSIIVVTRDGTTLSGIDFRGASVIVQANDVTIANSAFDSQKGTVAINGVAGYTNLTVTNSHFDGLKSTRADFYDFIASKIANTAISDNVFVNAPSDVVTIESGTISHNYIAGGGYTDGQHADAIWIGNTTGSVVIKDNVIDWRKPGDAIAETNNAIRITDEKGSTSNVQVTGNILLGGTYTVLVTDQSANPGTVSGVVIENNVVDFGQYGPLYPHMWPIGLIYTGNQDATGPHMHPGAETVAAQLETGSLNRIAGTEANDAIVGTSLGDHILTGGGQDYVRGGGGNDVIDGGDGRDYMTGGAGSDVFVYNRAGDFGDLISDFTHGVDRLDFSGLDGAPDEAAGWTWLGTARFTGAAWEMRYEIGSSTTEILIDADGDLKSDLMLEFAGAQAFTTSDFILQRTAYQPTIIGAGTIAGTLGDDVILGSDGRDSIHARAGNDVLIGGLGKDILNGGVDSDIFVYRSVDDSKAGGERDYVAGFELGKDRFDLSAIDANALTSARDAFSWLGDTAFSGQAGELRFETRSGNTFIQMDVNGDRIADGEIELRGTYSLTRGDFTDGSVASADETASTVPMPDSATGNGNLVTGTDVADIIKGTDGNDVIFAGNGNDTVRAGAGDDTIHGDGGKDVLFGGAGHDTFAYLAIDDSKAGGGTRDYIADFVKGEDRFDFTSLLSATGASASWLGTDTFAGDAGSLRFEQRSTSTIVQLDLDGNMLADMEVELAGLHQLHHDDFLV